MSETSSQGPATLRALIPAAYDQGGGDMADIVRIGSGVPRVPLRRADDLLERVAALKADAEARGFGTLAYFLEAARMEAQLQVERGAEEQEMRKRNPDQLWRPIEDQD